jgi:hypothetical protein
VETDLPFAFFAPKKWGDSNTKADFQFVQSRSFMPFVL